MEGTKVNVIMDQLEKSDGNGHHRRKNINHFVPLYGSYNNESTQNGEKPNNPSIVLRGKDKGSKNKKGQKISMKKMETTRKIRQQKRCMTSTVRKN